MSKRLRSSEMCADCSGPGESPGRARSLSAAPRDPCPAAAPAGPAAPGGRVLHPKRPGAPLGAPGAASGREPSRACQRRAGRGPPPSRPSVPPVRRGAGWRPGRCCHRKGLGPRTGSQLQKSVRAPAAPAAQVSLRPPPPRPRAAAPPGALPGWATFGASLRRDQPAAPRTPPPPDLGPRSPGEAGRPGLADAAGTRSRRRLRFGHRSGPSSHQLLFVGDLGLRPRWPALPPHFFQRAWPGAPRPRWEDPAHAPPSRHLGGGVFAL